MSLEIPNKRPQQEKEKEKQQIKATQFSKESAPEGTGTYIVGVFMYSNYVMQLLFVIGLLRGR